jgi:hypothetical protein
LNSRSDFNLDVWANLAQGPEVDDRPAEEILGDILGRLSSAYGRFAALGEELGVKVRADVAEEARAAP